MSNAGPGTTEPLTDPGKQLVSDVQKVFDEAAATREPEDRVRVWINQMAKPIVQLVTLGVLLTEHEAAHTYFKEWQKCQEKAP